MRPRLAALLPLGIALFAASCQTDRTLPTFTGGNIKFPSARLWPIDPPIMPTIHANLTKPDGAGPFPTVVLLHSCGGVSSNVSDDWPTFFKSLGYASVVVYTYASRGYGPCPNAIDQDYDLFAADAYGALQYLDTLPYADADRAAVMGFSVGGIAVTELVTRKGKNVGKRDFRAAINMYGRCRFWGEPFIPTLTLIGERDKNAQECLTMHPSAVVEVRVLPGAFHTFDRVGARGSDRMGNIMAYSASTTTEAQRTTADFLARHFDASATRVTVK